MRRPLPTLTWLALAAVMALGVASHHQLTAQESDEPQLRVPGDPQHMENLARAAVEQLDYVPGEVIVKFKEGLPEGGEQRVLASALVFRRAPKTKWIGDAVVLYLEPGMDTISVATTLAEDPDVEYAEPNYIRQLHWRPNDTYYSEQWNLQALDMERAWDINRGASGDVVVAVIDSGMAYKDITFQYYYWTGRVFARVLVPFAAADDLMTDGRVVSPWDFLWVDESPVDMTSHGTHVAGTIGQLTNNGRGVAGIASNVRLMPLKVCYGQWDLQFARGSQGRPGFIPYKSEDSRGCCDDATVSAIRYAADQGADVINLSLGGPAPNPFIRDALIYAIQKGVFIAAAMGNDYLKGNPIEYPAAYADDLDGMVSVGAVNRSLTRAYYSSTGPHIELVAPGGDICSQSLDCTGYSGGIWQQTLDGYYFDYPTSWLIIPQFDVLDYVSIQGTSMATPHVAGAAALLISQGITHPAAVEAALKRTARDLGPKGFDQEYGYGLIQPRNALRGLGWVR